VNHAAGSGAGLLTKGAHLMSDKADLFVNQADWLASPVSIPIASDQAKKELMVQEALVAAGFLEDAGRALNMHFEGRARKHAEEVIERLGILAVALRQWAHKYGKG
jgi:hypothetical protein